MTDLHRLEVIVAGAGAIGLAIAVELTRAGARVRVIDEAAAGNASSIAAGMLAPALETALDPGGESFAELKKARDLWPAFADDMESVGLEACGAEFEAAPSEIESLAGRLAADGARYERRGARLFTPEDWRLEPELALAAMRRCIVQRGGEFTGGRLTQASARTVALADGASHDADAVVLACGYGGRGLAPELAVLTPVKGQIVRYEGPCLTGGPILRNPDGYVVPGASGACAGATMEPGRSDTAVEDAVIARLVQNALVLAPALQGASFHGRAGVRAQTPDRRCLIGCSETGVWLAAGARRNGWLLAPLAARMVAVGLATGREEPVYTPGRFSRRP